MHNCYGYLGYAAPLYLVPDNDLVFIQRTYGCFPLLLITYIKTGFIENVNMSAVYNAARTKIRKQAHTK